jgi:hypothetical protein
MKNGTVSKLMRRPRLAGQTLLVAQIRYPRQRSLWLDRRRECQQNDMAVAYETAGNNFALLLMCCGDEAGRGWRIFAAPRPLHVFITACDPLAWRHTLLIVTPGGTYNYGHRRSQIGHKHIGPVPLFSCHTNIVFFPTSRFCLPFWTRLATHWKRDSHLRYRTSNAQPVFEYLYTFINDNDILPTTIPQRPSQLPQSLPPNANALPTRHLVSLGRAPSIHSVAILEHIRKTCTQGHRHLRRRHDPPQPIIDFKFTYQGEPVRGSRATEAQRSCAPVLLLWARREGTATGESELGV